jgi:hypothetical protein
MEDDSESSCTYKDYVTAYSSTRDSELWHTQYAVNTEANSSLGVERVPIMLRDEPVPDDVSYIPHIGPSEAEEMTMEPLFSVPNVHQSMVESIIPYKKGSLLVSASTFGLKCLVFSLSGCIMCTQETDNTGKVALYIPYRFFKKIVTDCGIQGVECNSQSSRLRSLYHQIQPTDIPEAVKSALVASQQSIISSGTARHVTQSLTPVSNDGLKYYYPVDIVLFIVLEPQKKKKMEDESGNIVVHRSKREVKVVPLSVTGPLGHGNDVASRTKSL